MGLRRYIRTLESFRSFLKRHYLVALLKRSFLANLRPDRLWDSALRVTMYVGTSTGTSRVYQTFSHFDTRHSLLHIINSLILLWSPSYQDDAHSALIDPSGRSSAISRNLILSSYKQLTPSANIAFFRVMDRSPHIEKVGCLGLPSRIFMADL